MVEASIPKYYSLEEKEYITPYYNIRNDYKEYHSLKTPIIIDNGKLHVFPFFFHFPAFFLKILKNNIGSKQCRAGWATERDPSRKTNLSTHTFFLT